MQHRPLAREGANDGLVRPRFRLPLRDRGRQNVAEGAAEHGARRARTELLLERNTEAELDQRAVHERIGHFDGAVFEVVAERKVREQVVDHPGLRPPGRRRLRSDSGT